MELGIFKVTFQFDQLYNGKLPEILEDSQDVIAVDGMDAIQEAQSRMFEPFNFDSDTEDDIKAFCDPNDPNCKKVSILVTYENIKLIDLELLANTEMDEERIFSLFHGVIVGTDKADKAISQDQAPEHPDFSHFIKESHRSREFFSRLPVYQSHKIIAALRIDNIAKTPIPTDTGVCIIMYSNEIGNGIQFNIPIADYKKHNPQIGGYWVFYQDGYESYSPTKPFKKGNTRIR